MFGKRYPLFETLRNPLHSVQIFVKIERVKIETTVSLTWPIIDFSDIFRETLMPVILIVRLKTSLEWLDDYSFLLASLKI